MIIVQGPDYLRLRKEEKTQEVLFETSIYDLLFSLKVYVYTFIW